MRRTNPAAIPAEPTLLQHQQAHPALSASSTLQPHTDAHGDSTRPLTLAATPATIVAMIRARVPTAAASGIQDHSPPSVQPCDVALQEDATEDEPNAQTLAAANEYYEMQAHPERYKRYESFADALKDILEGTDDEGDDNEPDK